MRQEEPWAQAADLEDAPLVIPSGDGLALRARSLVNPPQIAPKWHSAMTPDEIINGEVQLSGFTLIEETHDLLLKAGKSVDAGGLGVEEVGDAALLFK
jgi:hypothetical protein